MSTLKADTIQNTSGGAATLTKQSAAKMWSDFDGNTSNTVMGSFNLSSVDDLATGTFRHNLTNSMSDAHYSAQHTATDDAATGTSTDAVWNKLSGSFKGECRNTAGTLKDRDSCLSVAHGDLA